MQTRRLGRTGHQSSLAVLGGIVFHFLEVEEGERVLQDALARGVNHLDIAPGYMSAEEKAGAFLPKYRDQLFLGEKSGAPTRDGVWADLERTLTRLGVDAVDLYQLHGVTDLADLDSRAGAAQALMEIREQGLCRWIGTTGHNVTTAAAQLEAVRRYDTDTVMLPIYPALWADADYRRDAEELLAHATEHDLGVHVIKAGAARPWADGADRTATTWYEPQLDEELLTLGVRFALSTPGVTAFCTPGDAALLPIALRAAEAFDPLDDSARESAVAAAAGEALIFPIPV